MNIMIVGSNGMVGQGVLNACLKDNDVHRIVLPLRQIRADLPQDARIVPLIVSDLTALSAQDERLSQLDACFFCAGVSSLGMSENDYRKITFDMTLHIAKQMAIINPNMSFIYISGAGADSSEQSPTMWKRVRGETENALLALSLNTHIFRPSFIMAEQGIRSKTPAYEMMYRVMRPLVRALDKIVPLNVLTTADIGNAMLNLTRQSERGLILDNQGIMNKAKSG